MPSEEVLEKYEEVKSSLDRAVSVAENIKLSGDEENAELIYVRNTLEQLNSGFKEEIEKLEKSSEWDKFCIAFFGETNAGKSTIIDALRIIYDEETRRNHIDDQKKNIDIELEKEKKDYAELINSIHNLNESLEKQEVMNRKYRIRIVLFTVLGIIIGVVIGLMICNAWG